MSSSLNDFKEQALLAMGYTGSLNDMEAQFWANYNPSAGVTLAAIQAVTGPDGSKYVRILTGNYQTAANGSTSVFTIPHGAAALPVYANATANSALGDGNKFITWNATNITVTFDVAPAAGTLNLNWIALVS